MKRISKTSIILKWVFPIFWIGLLGVFLSLALTAEKVPLVTILLPVVMMVFGFGVMKKLVWDLADEVYDAGDYLLFKKGGVEQQVYLSDIVNINHMSMSSPPRISVQCRTPGPLGTEISFSAPTSFNPFEKPELVRELIERVDRTRRR